MKELLTEFSLGQIFLFTFLILSAVKACWEVISFLYGKIRAAFDSKYKEERTKESIQYRLEKCENAIANWDNKMEVFTESIKSLNEECQKSFDKQNESLQMLIASDKDDIKSFIVREYHYFTEEKGWIDDFSLDVLEKRYSHYKAEGGNSFIEELMDEIRKLPHKPPKK